MFKKTQLRFDGYEYVFVYSFGQKGKSVEKCLRKPDSGSMIMNMFLSIHLAKNENQSKNV